MKDFPPQRPYHPFAGAEKEAELIGYDVNALVTEVMERARSILKEGTIVLHFTQSMGGSQASSGHSYCNEFSAIVSVKDGKPVLGGNYRPGNVLDFLFNRNGATFFASVFFDLAARLVRYRLVRLGVSIDGDLKQAIHRMAAAPATGDRILDEGEMGIIEDYVGTANRIVSWIDFQTTVKEKT